MLIIETSSNGKTTIRQVEDPPSDYTCAEWKAYEAACIESETKYNWAITQHMIDTYATYAEAMQARRDNKRG